MPLVSMAELSKINALLASMYLTRWSFSKCEANDEWIFLCPLETAAGAEVSGTQVRAKEMDQRPFRG